ncbi:MAG: methionyl-tRNA formyltransferase [Tannerella sp.]|jgi:methionyl-tRNA formyltransferase|nr:methionyl-tRNA formyltransferase [Tannerella sp.]
MEKKDLRIVFMGTPEFACASLRALAEGGYCVVGAVTMPDKPVGRHGSVLRASAVKQYALTRGIPVLQPVVAADAAFLDDLRALRADLQVVVAFRMLPEAVWSMPRFGTFNLHASLLPQYRGAAPINWAVIRGETETGVTTFFLTHGMDTGRIIMQRRLPVGDEDDAGAVHDRLMIAGAELTLDTVDLILAGDGRIDTLPQETLRGDAATLHTAPKLFTDTCRVDWRRPALSVCNLVRGLSPSPAAWTELVFDGGDVRTLKIYRASVCPGNTTLPAGTVRADAKADTLDVAAGDGFVRLLDVQLAGKKRMAASSFLNGMRQRILTAR